MFLKDEDVIGFERSFHVYYFDMIYSNPTIVEIDVLLMLRGGLVAIEEESGSPSVEDFIEIIGKQFSKGGGALPILYSPEGKEMANLKTANIYPFDRKNLNQILKEEKEFKPFDREGLKGKDRSDLFSLDNFLCALLLFGSPAISHRLAKWIRRTFRDFELVRRRCEILEEVKGIREKGMRSGADATS